MTIAVTRHEPGADDLRREAARHTGMDRQTLRDRVHCYNAGGLDALRDRPRSGRKPRLTPEQGAEPTPEQGAEPAAVVERGPDPDRDGVVRWRRVDPKALIEARFAVRPHERSVGKVLRRLGFTRISVRPKHPRADKAAQEAFEKASPRRSRRRRPSTPVADRSRSGSRCYEDGHRGE